MLKFPILSGDFGSEKRGDSGRVEGLPERPLVRTLSSLYRGGVTVLNGQGVRSKIRKNAKNDMQNAFFCKNIWKNAIFFVSLHSEFVKDK